MNAQSAMKIVPTATAQGPAQAALQNLREHLAELRKRIVGPQARLGPVQRVIAEAAEKQAAFAALRDRRREIEVQRLLGALIDVRELERVDRQLADAELHAAEAEERAIPARIAAGQLQAEVDTLRSTIAAEENRLPLLLSACLFEIGVSAAHSDKFREATRAWVVAMREYDWPFVGMDIIAQQHPVLGLERRTAILSRTIEVPMPVIDPRRPEQRSVIYRDLAGSETDALAQLEQLRAEATG